MKPRQWLAKAIKHLGTTKAGLSRALGHHHLYVSRLCNDNRLPEQTKLAVECLLRREGTWEIFIGD